MAFPTGETSQVPFLWSLNLESLVLFGFEAEYDLYRTEVQTSERCLGAASFLQCLSICAPLDVLQAS